MEHVACPSAGRNPWNKGKLVGQKAPFKLKEIWAIRVRLQLADRRRELALFNLAIDSKLRACDLVKNARGKADLRGGESTPHPLAARSLARTISERSNPSR
jgi:hypothetical protein